MNNKKIILLFIVLLLIIACCVLVILANSVTYERIEITPNGTTIDVPTNQTKYYGDLGDIKIWYWNNGILVTYNSHEGSNPLKLSRFSFSALDTIIKNGDSKNIDGFTCYSINADKLLKIHLFDIIKVYYNGQFYCIPLNNGTTHDNIVICSNDEAMALHMAKSVEYKNVYPENNNLENAKSAINNMSGDLQSKANGYINNTNFNNAKSQIEGMARDYI